MRQNYQRLINYWHIKTLITKYLATRDDNILKKVLGLTNNQIKIISENTDNDLLNEILEEHLNTDEFLKD